MREKMKANARHLDIKQGDGGLIDIEFISQFGVLAYAADYPELVEWTDNIRILEVLSRVKCFGDVSLEPLESAYRELRSALHRNSLAEDNGRSAIEDFPDTTQQVEGIWRQLFEETA